MRITSSVHVRPTHAIHLPAAALAVALAHATIGCAPPPPSGSAPIPVPAAADTPDAPVSGMLGDAFGDPIVVDVPAPSLDGHAICGDLSVAVHAFEARLADHWIATGRLDGPSRTRGTCGGAGAEQAMPFVVPTDGVYTAIAAADSGDPLAVYARPFCVDAGRDAQLACAMPLAAGEPTALTVEATAGDTVWLFVDAADKTLPGTAFTVDLRRTDGPAAPDLLGLAATTLVDGVHIAGGLVDVDADVTEVTVSYLDAARRMLTGARPLVPGRRWMVETEADIDVVLDGRVPPDAVAVRIIARDAQRHLAVAEVRLQAQEVLELGWSCDPEALANRCEPGMACRRLGDVARCVAIEGPTLVDADARRSGDRIGVRLETFAAGPRVTAVRLVPLDDGGLQTAAAQVIDLPHSAAMHRVSGVWSARVDALRPPVFLEVTVIDSEGRTAGRIVPIREVQAAEAGDVCDEVGVTHQCAAGQGCVEADGVSRCLPGTVPHVDEGHLFVDRDDHRFDFWLHGIGGVDPLTDAVQYRFMAGRSALSDWTSTSVTAAECFQGACMWRVSGWLPARIHDVRSPVSVEARLESERGGLGDMVRFGEGAQPRRVGAGTTCATVRKEVCGGRTACVKVPAGHRICVPRTAPDIDSAHVWLNRETNAIGIWITGSDPDHDVEAVAIHLRNRSLRSMRMVRDIVPVEPTWTPDGRFTIAASVPAHHLAAHAELLDDPLDFGDSAAIVVLDEARQASGVRERWLREAPVIEAGGACDALGGLGRCDSGLVCGAVAGSDDWRCARRWQDCPAGFVLPALHDAPDWRTVIDAAEGQALAPVPGLEEDDVIHAFEAPRDGTYRFVAKGPEGLNPRLTVRSGCAVEGSELDSRVALRGTAAVDLRGGETVYVVVHDVEDFDEVELTAEQYAVPKIIEGHANRTEEGVWVHVEAVMDVGSTRVRRIGVVAIDEAGRYQSAQPGLDFDSVGRIAAVEVWRGAGHLAFGAEGTQPERLRLTPYDERGVAGEPIDLDIRISPIVLLDEPCDPTEGANRCSWGKGCPADDEAPVCENLWPGTCEDRPVRDEFERRGSKWVLFGDRTDGETVDGVHTPCFPTTGRAHLHRFVPLRWGTHRFRVTGRGVRLFAREVCDVAQDTCADTLPYSPHEDGFEMEVSPREPIFLYVDGVDPDATDYAVTVEWVPDR